MPAMSLIVPAEPTRDDVAAFRAYLGKGALTLLRIAE